jgi:hypothetical protein
MAAFHKALKCSHTTGILGQSVLSFIFSTPSGNPIFNGNGGGNTDGKSVFCKGKDLCRLVFGIHSGMGIRQIFELFTIIKLFHQE